MADTLNITNGDNAVEIMKAANISGEFLPWRDVLHEGPVPGDCSLEELSKVRANYISDSGWGDFKEIHRSFIERDTLLKSYKNYKKVILWFEHDLYDQLQILQLLDWFHGQDLQETSLSLICTNRYLGMLAPDQMSALLKYEVPVTEAQRILAQQAWAAFRERTPETWQALLNQDTNALKFLKSAIKRMIQEYPSKENGLSRTEQQALAIISEGEKRPDKVFIENQKLEESQFLGDASFWNILRGFLKPAQSLLRLSEGNDLTVPINSTAELSVTTTGGEVLSGQLNWLKINKIDRWIGGVHLNPGNLWCRTSIDGIGLARA